MRGAALANAVGLLKEELRRAGSLVMKCADETRVPAGGALAVDRDAFAASVTRAIGAHPRIRVEHRVVDGDPRARPPRDPRDRAAHRRRARRGSRARRRRGAPRVLRRDRAHRRAPTRSTWTSRVPAVALRQRVRGGRASAALGRGLRQLPVRRGAVPRVRRGARGRAEGRAARVRADVATSRGACRSRSWRRAGR